MWVGAFQLNWKQTMWKTQKNEGLQGHPFPPIHTHTFSPVSVIEAEPESTDGPSGAFRLEQLVRHSTGVNQCQTQDPDTAATSDWLSCISRKQICFSTQPGSRVCDVNRNIRLQQIQLT